MKYMVAEATVDLVLAGIAILTGIFSYYLYNEIQGDQQTTMAKLQLRSHETLLDFYILLGMNIMMLFGWILYSYGVIVSSEMFQLVAKLVAAMYGVLLVAVFYRWKVRFR